MRSISGFNGSSTGGSFGAGQPVYASALNKLATGIDQTRTMMSNDVQFQAGTGGTVYALQQEVTDGIGNVIPPPWTVNVETVVDGTTKTYFLKVVRGVCNYTWSEFPFGPETINDGTSMEMSEDGNKTYHNECIVTDYAVYPSGSYREGTDSTSDWMGGNAAIQIKNAADGGADVWYVTVSKLDWWNKLNWDDSARLQDKERPWVSVFAEGSACDGAISKPTSNSLGLHKVIFPPWPPVPDPEPPDPIGSDPFNGSVVAKHIGYDMKKVASLTWNDTDKVWDVVQYIQHQVELAIPYQQQFRWSVFIPGNLFNEQAYAISTHFASDINNLSLRSDLASISGYTINSTDWWYDLVVTTTPR